MILLGQSKLSNELNSMEKLRIIFMMVLMCFTGYVIYAIEFISDWQLAGPIVVLAILPVAFFFGITFVTRNLIEKRKKEGRRETLATQDIHPIALLGISLALFFLNWIWWDGEYGTNFEFFADWITFLFGWVFLFFGAFQSLRFMRNKE